MGGEHAPTAECNALLRVAGDVAAKLDGHSGSVVVSNIGISVYRSGKVLHAFGKLTDVNVDGVQVALTRAVLRSLAVMASKPGQAGSDDGRYSRDSDADADAPLGVKGLDGRRVLVGLVFHVNQRLRAPVPFGNARDRHASPMLRVDGADHGDRVDHGKQEH